MIVMGIDPGTAIVGFSFIKFNNNKFIPIDYGVIRTKSDKTDSERLEIIYDSLETLILKYKPKEVAVESIYFHKNLKTAITVAQARGVILLLCQKYKMDIFEYTPLEVKQAIVGYGKATKNQMQFMTKKLLGLNDIIRPDDAADAVGIAICHINSKRLLIKDKKIIEKIFIDKSYKKYK